MPLRVAVQRSLGSKDFTQGAGHREALLDSSSLKPHRFKKGEHQLARVQPGREELGARPSWDGWGTWHTVHLGLLSAAITHTSQDAGWGGLRKKCAVWRNASSSPRNLLKKCPLFQLRAKWQWPGLHKQELFVRSPPEPAAVLPIAGEASGRLSFPVFCLLGLMNSCAASPASQLPCYSPAVGVPSAKPTPPLPNPSQGLANIYVVLEGC